jgi:pantetheine-phosphate adenylyltransferase
MSRPLDPRHALYAGSFDPVTLGHEDIIRRGAAVFERITVAVGINPEKQPLFAPEQRLAMLREVLGDLPNVQVECFTGLTIDFARERGAAVMLRGVRTVSDMDAEFSLALANQTLAPEIETVFLVASDRFSHVSSTLIKQIAQLGGPDSRQQLRRFVPEPVIVPLLQLFRNG